MNAYCRILAFLLMVHISTYVYISFKSSFNDTTVILNCFKIIIIISLQFWKHGQLYVHYYNQKQKPKTYIKDLEK